MPKLLFIDDQFAGQTFDLRREKTMIGRGEQNDLIVPDASVSNQHCLILVNGAEVIVRELDSSNGTYVDDIRVAAQHPIKSGQRVRFGSAIARLEISTGDEPETAEEMTAILGYRRALKKGIPPLPTNDKSPHAKLHSPSPAAADEPTVMIGRPPVPDQPSPTRDLRNLPSGNVSTSQSSSTNGKSWMIMALVVIAVIAAVAYWAMSKRGS